ncbi:MAG: hypothetical protein L3K26_16715 [Candidatus Hydrogenedentes bacterium]|nr:hypothetical protein [Candidatus Hydrogenedentota bacterium]
MLVYEISKKAKRSKWRSLLSEITGALVTGSFAWLRLQEAEGSVLSLAVFGLIAFASLLALVHATRSFVANFLFGEIHYRIIVNSNTLALKRGGHPAVFIKRWDCIALARTGSRLVLADGSEHVPFDAISTTSTTRRIFGAPSWTFGGPDSRQNTWKRIIKNSLLSTGKYKGGP